MLRFNDILERLTSYNPKADVELLKKAYVVEVASAPGLLSLGVRTAKGTGIRNAHRGGGIHGLGELPVLETRQQGLHHGLGHPEILSQDITNALPALHHCPLNLKNTNIPISSANFSRLQKIRFLSS